MSALASTRPANRIPSWKGHLAAILTSAPIFAGLLVFAADNDVLASFLALAQILAALGVLLLLARDTPDSLWLRSLAPIACLTAAVAWSILGMTAPGRLATDAAPLEWLKIAGLVSGALSAALVAQSRRMLRRTAIWLAVFGVAYTMFSLWSGQVHPYTVWGEPKGAHTYRFTGTLMNANAAGCVFGMIGLICLGLMHHLFKRTDLRTSGLRHYAGLATVSCGAIAAVGACVLTSSRASLGAMALIALVLILLEARRSHDRFVLIVASIILAGGLVLAGGQVVSRWDTLAADAGLRLTGYAHYASGVVAAPWFGTGLGGFHAWHDTHLTPATAPAMWAYGAVHGAVLQAALEGGAPYALLLSAAVIVAAGQILAVAIKRRDGDIVANAMLGAGVLALVCASVDIALNVPAVAALACALFGAAWGSITSRVRATSSARSEHRDA